jgi:hypothetical protein
MGQDINQTKSYFRQVVGGKDYDRGNHVWILKRRIIIEFDSDYNISKGFKAKNWFKKACREAESIPTVVTLEWLVKHGYNVPKGCWKYIQPTRSVG